MKKCPGGKMKDDEDSDNEVEGVDVEGEKSDEDSTYVEDQGNEADRDTNVNLEGRDDVKADVVLPSSKLKALEDNFSEFKQTNQYAEALSSIPGIVDQYLANKMKEAVDVAVQLKSDRIREEAQAENQQFLDSIDEGMKKVIKEQVKSEVSKITPQIEKLVNEQLESEVLVRSSKEAKTSHAVAANLSELELKKILIDKMEANKSISRSDIQRQLYKALVDAYEAEKILLDTYGDTVTLKRPQDGADDQEPSAGTDRGSKRRRSGKEPESTSAPREKTTTTAGKTTTGSKTHKQSASQSAPVEETMQSTNVFEAPAHQELKQCPDEQPEEEVHPLPDWFQQPKRLPSPDRAWNKSVPADHESVQPWLSNLARRQDPRESFDELTDTTFELSSFHKATTEKLDWINPEGRQYPHDLRKPLPLVPNSQGRHVIQFHHFPTIMTLSTYWCQVDRPTTQFALGNLHWARSKTIQCTCDHKGITRDVYLKRRIIAVTKVEIVKWKNYKHLDWITVRRDGDILYKFKELTNLNVEERLAFNVSLRMFTRSVVIQRRVEDLQLGVESYQKKLNLTDKKRISHKRTKNQSKRDKTGRGMEKGVKAKPNQSFGESLTKPNTYISNLRRRDAYTPYSDPRGFIYENKDKKNRLMRIDELHKFSDGTLDDVRTALNDRLKGIRMEYLPQTFWSQRDKANARAMIQAIDKRLKTRRIMRSLERFVGGRPYGGDLRLLQRTINYHKFCSSSYKVDPHGFEGYLKMVVELTNLKKDVALKFFKTTIQERYEKKKEHVGSEITNPTRMAKYQECEEIVQGDCSQDAQDHNVKYKFKEQAQSRNQ
ncbi:hypothetical protein Tco_0496129 [Tanacetum coccineum]